MVQSADGLGDGIAIEVDELLAVPRVALFAKGSQSVRDGLQSPIGGMIEARLGRLRGGENAFGLAMDLGSGHWLPISNVHSAFAFERLQDVLGWIKERR